MSTLDVRLEGDTAPAGLLLAGGLLAEVLGVSRLADLGDATVLLLSEPPALLARPPVDEGVLAGLLAA